MAAHAAGHFFVSGFSFAVSLVLGTHDLLHTVLWQGFQPNELRHGTEIRGEENGCPRNRWRGK